MSILGHPKIKLNKSGETKEKQRTHIIDYRNGENELLILCNRCRQLLIPYNKETDDVRVCMHNFGSLKYTGARKKCSFPCERE